MISPSRSDSRCRANLPAYEVVEGLAAMLSRAHMLTGDLGAIFSALSSGGVRYLVGGGVAVVLHGHTRFTSDVDLVVALDEANVRRALEELRDGG